MALSDSSSLSSLSPPPPSDNEKEPAKPLIKPKTVKLKGGKLVTASRDASPLSPPEPPPPPREPTPPHEDVLADSPDIAFLVMFRSRFNGLFPKNVPNLGPQDIENGVVGSVPSEPIENFLCALLGLVLNRKKYVERGHHGRALEEAISSQRHQWPRSWGGSNPLPGTRTFSDMDPAERLVLLKTLVLWSLNTSEAVSNIIKESYKQSRHDDDLNQPLSVQPWGSDGRKRKYWLIEGQNDTPFRLYMERAPKTNNRTWWSVAGDLDELNVVGENLRKENSQPGRRLADSIIAAVPRLTETLERRKKKEYRQARKAQFQRPDPGFSLYEGRTRGRRVNYNHFDDEDASDSNSARRSTRQSNHSTPGPAAAPTVTASGRQVRSRFGNSHGEPTQTSSDVETSRPSRYANHENSRPRRSAGDRRRRSHVIGANTDEDMSDEEDEAVSSGEEWDGDDEDVEGKLDPDDEEETSDAPSDDSMMEPSGSLIITLKYRKDTSNGSKQDNGTNGSSSARLESSLVSDSPARLAEQKDNEPSLIQPASNEYPEPQPPVVDQKGSSEMETTELWQPGSFSAYAYQPPGESPAIRTSNPIAGKSMDGVSVPKQLNVAHSSSNGTAITPVQLKETSKDIAEAPIHTTQRELPGTTINPINNSDSGAGHINGYINEEYPHAKLPALVAEEPPTSFKNTMSSLHTPHAAQISHDYP